MREDIIIDNENNASEKQESIDSSNIHLTKDSDKVDTENTHLCQKQPDIFQTHTVSSDQSFNIRNTEITDNTELNTQQINETQPVTTLKNSTKVSVPRKRKQSQATITTNTKSKRIRYDRYTKHKNMLVHNVSRFLDKVFDWDKLLPKFYLPENLQNITVAKPDKHLHACFKIIQKLLYNKQNCQLVGNVRINTKALNSMSSTIKDIESIDVEFNLYNLVGIKEAPTFRCSFISNNEKLVYLNLWKKFESEVYGNVFDRCKSCISQKELLLPTYDYRYTLKPFPVQRVQDLEIDVFFHNPNKNIPIEPCNFDLKAQKRKMLFVFYDVNGKTIQIMPNDSGKYTRDFVGEIYKYQIAKNLSELFDCDAYDIIVFIPFLNQINTKENTKKKFFSPSVQPIKTSFFNSFDFMPGINAFHSIGYLENNSNKKISKAMIKKILENVSQVSFYPLGIFPYNENLNTSHMQLLTARVYLAVEECIESQKQLFTQGYSNLYFLDKNISPYV